MLTLNRFPLCLLLTGCLLAFGCSKAKEVGKTLGDLAEVRSELIKKFGEQDVNLRVNNIKNRTLVFVIYVNSPLNQKAQEDRGRRAQETAEIVKQYFPSIKDDGQIWVGFMRATTRWLIFHWSEMLESYGFDGEARSLRDSGSTPVDSGRPGVRYTESQNKSEISSSSVQLEGTSEKGVLFFPHFSVDGDASKITPKPPREVELDFAAFSDKPKFPNVTKIVFLSDDKEVYRTEGQFSTSKIAGDMYSEFLYLKIPTAEFLKIMSGSTINLRLNEHEYSLTESQILKLQQLSDYLKGLK